MPVMSSNGKLKSSGASVVKVGSWEIRQRCIGGHPAVAQTGIFSSNCWSRKSSSPEDESESYMSGIPNRCGAKSSIRFRRGSLLQEQGIGLLEAFMSL